MNKKPEEKQEKEENGNESGVDVKKALSELAIGVKVVLDPSDAMFL